MEEVPKHFDHSQCLIFIVIVPNKSFSLLMCTKVIAYGPVKKFAKPLYILWIIFSVRFGTKIY